MAKANWRCVVLGSCLLTASAMAGAGHVPQGVFAEEALQAAMTSPDLAIQAIAWVSQPRGNLTEPQIRDWHGRWLQSRPDAATRALLARHACGRGDAWGALCVDSDLWQDWVAHEPGNAQPRLLQAWLAQQQGDAEALQRALAQVAGSEYIDTGLRQDLALARHWVATMLDPATSRGERAMHAFGIWAAFVQPMQAYTQLCPTGRSEPVRAERRELCSQMARWIIEPRDGGMLVSGIGFSIAMAYAESAEERRQLLVLKHQQAELLNAFMADGRMNFDPAEGIPDHADDYLQLVIEHGEREAMIDWLALAPEHEPGVEE